MFKKPLVIVDLETSGVDPKVNEIIEIALIRYEGGKEVSRYQQLVRFEGKLPRIITAITGITDELLEEEGKSFDTVFEAVQPLLRDAYIMGHNGSFDVGFLKAAGFQIDELGLIDTIPLAQMVFPQAPSYSLESLSDDLGIAHEDSHRAMADVEATLALFKIMWGKLSALPKATIMDIQEHVARCDWEGGVVFEELVGGSIESKKSASKASSPPTKVQISPEKPLEIDDIFKEDGVLSQVFEGFEPRRQQFEMAQNVMNAFSHGYHLICEAPTGVGKSLAYLSAAANIALSNKSKVVISTNTLNLQQQLFEKDIPLLQSLYEHATGNSGVRVAVLKGRRHYLCLRRLAEFKRRPRYSDDEIILLIKILVWQSATHTGDSAEIHLRREETLIWNFELCSEKSFCSPQKCKPFGDCYLHKAREMAEQADIIIVNHALLCADLERDGGLLPEYQYLVVDEAHHFENASTHALSVAISQESFRLPLQAIHHHLMDFERRHGSTLFGQSPAFKKLEAVMGVFPDLQQFIDNFFSVVALFVNRQVPDSGYIEKLLIDRLILAMPEWLNLGTSMEEVMLRLKDLVKELRSLLDQFLLSDDLPDLDDFSDELLQEIETLQEQMGYLSLFFNDDHNLENRQIRWMASSLRGEVSLFMAPLLLGNTLKPILYDQKKSIVFTSATLSVSTADDRDVEDLDPFIYLRRMLGLDERFESLVLDTPFDYETQAYVLLPSDLLSLNHRDSMQQIGTFFADLIPAVRGGLLGLFTSYNSIETLYLNLMEKDVTQVTNLLAQRISGGRNKILKAYLKSPQQSVLFGTSSFWEGVDIQGEALTSLVIHKFPFDVPSDPIFKARQELFDNAFMQYSLPRAILRFKQGFGRLIRSTKDYGCLVILDNRITTKRYGELFLKALPEGITIENAPLAQVPAKVAEWISLQRN